MYHTSSNQAFGEKLGDKIGTWAEQLERPGSSEIKDNFNRQSESVMVEVLRDLP
jgi:hypothetical protein